MKSMSSRLEPAPTCCDRYDPPGASTRAISSQTVTTGCRLTTNSKDPSAKGDRASSAVSMTKTPKGSRLRVAIRTFGGHDSVAANLEGRCSTSLSTPAKTSPPPVWISRTADARPIRCTSIPV